jgi:pimeloyl-ACP methyl ester carboxylesterase
MKKPFLILGAICSLLLASTPELHADGYSRWLSAAPERLAEPSTVAMTAKGPIEYIKRGRGPVVICLHGGPGGYDQSLLIGAHLIEQGFTVIGVSRPGYLRTPLGANNSAAGQADGIIALMDTLNIRKAAVLGFSAGSIVAAQSAIRWPHRVWAIVLQSVGEHPGDNATYSALAPFLEANAIDDFGPWLLYLAARDRLTATLPFVLAAENNLPDNVLAERIAFVTTNTAQRHFARKFLYTLTPLSLRREGLLNDILDVNPWFKKGFHLERLNTPTIMIQSQFDANGDYDEGLRILAAIPAVHQLVTVQASGHFLWLGPKTDAWRADLVDFLKEYQPVQN